MQQKISNSILKSDQPINRQIIKIDDTYMKLSVYWIFLRTGKSEILLSERNKHSFYELQFMIDGHICQMTERDGQELLYTIGDGEFMIMPPMHYHQALDSSEEGARFSVAFQIECKDPFIQAALDQCRQIKVFKAPEISRTYVSLMLETSRKESPWASREVSNLLQCLLLRLFTVMLPTDELTVERNIKPVRSASMMAEIQKYITDHISDGITVEDVAAHLGRSARHLNRICHSYTDKTLNQLIGEEKLKYIKELIGTSELSFAEIADMAGFSSEYALNRFFKYAEGYTLGQYRKLATLS